jgi:tight adherence protein B
VSPQAWWVAAFLLAGVVVVVWPVSLAQRRWAARGRPDGVPTRRRADLRAAVLHLPLRHPRGTVAVAGLLAASGGLLAAGPVAAVLAGTYLALGARALVRRSVGRGRAVARSQALDDLGALAADLRAGLPPGDLELGAPRSGAATPAFPAPSAPAPSADLLRLRELTEAVWRLAERTGAPVAELVERIEADARAADRARASAAAQAAGARATAMLLAGLPAGGIALGYAIGVDPMRVLLHSPLGAACAGGALILQLGGLAWADRLAMAGTVR